MELRLRHYSHRLEVVAASPEPAVRRHLLVAMLIPHPQGDPPMRGRSFTMLLLVALSACGKAPGNVTLDRWTHGDAEPGQWLGLGRTYKPTVFRRSHS